MQNNSIIFNSFVNILLNPAISTKAKQQGISVKDYIYDNKKFDVWLCSKSIVFENSDLNSTFDNDNQIKALSENFSYIGNIGALRTENVFSMDGLPSEDSYQKILNIPASAYIFSEYQYPTNCKLNKDYNYYAFPYYVADTTNKVNNIKMSSPVIGSTYLRPNNNYDITLLTNYNSSIKKDWTPNKDYFLHEYNFSSGYNSEEYAMYSVDEELLIEDQINITTNRSTFEIPPINSIGGALLISWNDKERENIYNHNGELTNVSGKQYKIELPDGTIETKEKHYPLAYTNFPKYSGASIPVCYSELPKNYNLKEVLLNIEWSQNGIFSLK